MVEERDVKAVQVLFPFAGDTIVGGSHVSALGLAAALDRCRYEPLVLMHFLSGDVGDLASSAGLECRILKDVPLLSADKDRAGSGTGVSGYLFKVLPSLVAELRRSGASIVHTNDGRMHGNWAPAARLARSKLVWHHRGDPKARAVNVLAPILADHIVSVSDFSRPARPVRSIDGKFSVVRSPFDFPHPAPSRSAGRAAILAELGLPDDALLLGYFGILNARKRPQHFVRAVERIAAALPDRSVHGLLYGAPESAQQRLDQECLDLARDLGIGDRIHLMGFRRPIEPHIAGVDFTLVTALNEPFGRTLIEAMYLQTPVIATRHGGNVEAIRDGVTGFLVDPDDPGAFSAPVVRLASDTSLRDTIVDAAKDYAQSNFGTTMHAERIMAIYDRILGATQIEETRNAAA
jgi:glycosyltransferase involved in cell wall biosynthesis